MTSVTVVFPREIKNIVVDIQTGRLTKLALQVLVDGNEPSGLLRDYFSKKRPGKTYRKIVAGLIFFLLRNKKALFLAVSPDLKGLGCETVIRGVLELTVFRTLSADLSLFSRNANIVKQDLQLKKIENSPLQTSKSLSFSKSYPKWIVSYFLLNDGLKRTLQLLDDSFRPNYICLRANSIKIKCPTLIKKLREKGIECSSSNNIPDCIYVRTEKKISELSLFKSGEFEIQDFGSQLIVKALNVKKHSTVVDFCAGAGGKSLAIGSLMRNTGVVYSFDISKNKIDKLKIRLARSGLKNIYPVLLSGLNDKRLNGFHLKASKVLVDAPCTCSGTFRHNPHLKWKVSSLLLKELTKRQGEILEKASYLCSQGGTLMYATCSLFKDENERVIENFLKSNTEFFVQPLDKSYVKNLLEELKESVFIDKLGGVTLFDPRISKYGFYFINLTKKC